MPPDTDHDQELSLKKRARRRLVGAVGLVLLMVGVLPMVLQDRASLTPNSAIKITMAGVDAGVVEPIAPPAPLVAPPLPSVSPLAAEVTANSNPAANDNMASAATAPIKPAESPLEKPIEKSIDAKPDNKPLELKPQSAAAAPAKAEDGAVTEPAKSGFAIQIGVYSAMASVTELESKLKQAGYSTSIKKVSTDKGEKLRLRTGDYPTRQQAAQAMLKLQSLNIQGMVVAND